VTIDYLQLIHQTTCSSVVYACRQKLVADEAGCLCPFFAFCWFAEYGELLFLGLTPIKATCHSHIHFTTYGG
jgi:hypothetical protein